jgi:hypothetical protein
MKKLSIFLLLVLLAYSLFANGVLIKNGISGQYLTITGCRVETVITNQVATTVATMRFYNNYSVSTTPCLPFLIPRKPVPPLSAGLSTAPGMMP